MGDPNITIPDEAREVAYACGAPYEKVDAALAAAAPLIVAAERDRLLPELTFLFEHADDYDVPFALRRILAGTWDLAEAQRAALRGRVGSLTHKEGEQP